MASDGSVPQTRTHRRIERTRASIEEAFIAAVSARGYDNVTVEDIAEGADVAKATFYAHFDNKEALLDAVFSRLTQELAARAAPAEQHHEIRWHALAAIYAQAAELRNLYLICLKNADTRRRYVAQFAGYAEQAYRARIAELGGSPQVSVHAAAVAFAGAHAAILETWLDGDLAGTAEEMAAAEFALVSSGIASALGVDLTHLAGSAPLQEQLPGNG